MVSALDEPAFWSPALSPATLIVVAAPDWVTNANLLPLDRIRPQAEYEIGSERLIAIDDLEGRHYLWLKEAEALRRAVVLIPYGDAASLQSEVLQRLHRRLSGEQGWPLPRPLALTRQRRARLIDKLHALDLAISGMAPRQIAAELFDNAAATMRAIEWKSSALRRKTMRLIKDAQTLTNGGHRDLLQGF